ncbi:MAG: ATP-binding cassette domain-containing protein [Gammaproteobacteria bacterium]|nr:ATP-binding cassette domain-containing protein [Gammaproteobacteria bacterium]
MTESGKDEKKSALARLQPLKFLWPFARPYKKQVVLALIFLILAALAMLALPAAVREMIDNGFDSANSGNLDRHFLWVFLVAVMMGVFSSLRFYWVSWLGERVVADVRIALYHHISGMSPSFFEHTRTGEVLSRLNTDTTLIDSVVGSSFSIALRSAAVLIGSIVMLFITSPKMAAILALAIPVVLAPILFFGRRIRAMSRQSQDSIADFSALATESINAIHTVQSFAAEPFERKRFSATVMTSFAKAKKRIVSRSLMTAIVVITLFGGIILMLRSGAYDVASGAMSAGTLSQFILYALFAASSAGGLSEVWGTVQRAAGAVERIAELMHTASEIQSPAAPHPLGTTTTGAFEFNDVSFSYPSRPDRLALKDFSLQVAPGETVALVGPSGAGKSTVMDLLLRFYDPQHGVISVNGIDIRSVALADLRSRFGLVAQRAEIFSCSARDNIAYGLTDVSDEAVVAAAKTALADEFIRNLTDGYDTYLGERGVRLSGGQQQRIAIARAVVRNPAILLLDEATSSLDARSEALVQRALDNVMKNRTTLVIAHRLATVLKVDRIIVMDEGRVVATGSHEELLRQDGIYQEFAALQLNDQRVAG